MRARITYGTMSIVTTTLVQWMAGMLAIAGVSIPDMEATVTRARLRRWYGDGMSAAVAADSVRGRVLTAKRYEAWL